MRPKTEKRWAAATLLAIFAITGCDSKPMGKGSTSESTTAGLAPSSGPNARQAADAFLKNLTEGKASPDQFTAWFKKQTSRLIAEVDAADWLADFKGTTFVVGEETKFGNSIVLRGRAEPAKDSFTLRLTKEGDSLKVDWLHRSSRMSSGISAPADSDLAAAQDTARNFLDVLLGGSLRQAQTLMTFEWKKSVAGEDLGFLTQKMRTWKSWDGDFVGYTIKSSELNGTKDAATFTVEMDAGTKKTPYTVKAKNVNGQWLLEAFSK